MQGITSPTLSIYTSNIRPSPQLVVHMQLISPDLPVNGCNNGKLVNGKIEYIYYIYNHNVTYSSAPPSPSSPDKNNSSGKFICIIMCTLPPADPFFVACQDIHTTMHVGQGKVRLQSDTSWAVYYHTARSIYTSMIHTLRSPCKSSAPPSAPPAPTDWGARSSQQRLLALQAT